MIKMFPKGYRENPVAYQADRLVVGIPQWVSEMGLDWLYELLLRFEDLWKTKAPRQG